MWSKHGKKVRYSQFRAYISLLSVLVSISIFVCCVSLSAEEVEYQYEETQQFVDLVNDAAVLIEEKGEDAFDEFAVQVIPLSPDTALLTSQEMVDMQLKSGQSTSSSHIFTMIWMKEQTGWQILHSHESWVDEPAK